MAIKMNQKIFNGQYDYDQRMNVEDINKNFNSANCQSRIINECKNIDDYFMLNSQTDDRYSKSLDDSNENMSKEFAAFQNKLINQT